MEGGDGLVSSLLPQPFPRTTTEDNHTDFSVVIKLSKLRFSRSSTYDSSNVTLVNGEDGYGWASRPPSADVGGINERNRSSSAGVDLNMPNTSNLAHAAIQPIIAEDPTGLTAVWSPPRPVIDFIFIHGLGGRSGKTWYCNSDLGTFWPSWLHEEPELLSARVHTFGYSAGIAGTANSSGMFDFARDLLFKMKYEYVNYERGPPIGSVGLPFSDLTLLPVGSKLYAHPKSRFLLSSLHTQWEALLLRWSVSLDSATFEAYHESRAIGLQRR